jgi:hypothetical protein
MLVRVRNPEYARRGVWFFDQPEYFEYSGLEVRVKHVSALELALTTGDPEWPVRVIQRDRIISIDGVATTMSSQPQPQTRTVKGSKGNDYILTRNAHRWTCSCPGFQFRNSCKHVAEA